jgi:Tfp pilus assembly protein PilF
MISWILASCLVSPCSSTEIEQSKAVALEKLADKQFAAHDVACVENYRDTVFAWSKIDKKSADRLRAIEKLCKALTYDRAPNAMTCDFRTTEIADDVTASGLVPAVDIPKLISIINCSDGFSANMSIQHISSWLDVLRQIGDADLKDKKDQKACLEKLVPVAETTDNLSLMFSAYKVIKDAPEINRSMVQDVRNKLESSIANIREDLPEFSLLTSSQLETIRNCKVSTLDKSLQSTMEPDAMTDALLKIPVAERGKTLQILLKQESSYDPNDIGREVALGWCCDLTGAHKLASKYYSKSLSRSKRLISEAKVLFPNLMFDQCLAQLSLVSSYLADNQLQEVKPLIAALPEAHANGFSNLVLPLEGELAWKSGRLSEAESMLTQAIKKFNSLPSENELDRYLHRRTALKAILPGEERTLSSLIEVLKLEHKNPEAEKRQNELKALRESMQNSDQMDKYRRLPWFPGSRDPACARSIAPAYLKAVDATYRSEDARLNDLDRLAQQCIEGSMFETARIFVDDALVRLRDKTDERSQSFRALFLLKQIEIDTETGKFEEALTEIDAITKLLKPTNKDTQLEILDVKGSHARVLLYERKFSEAQDILESIYPDCRKDYVLDLARVYLAQKNYKLAESTLRTYLKELRRGGTDAQFNYAQILLANLYAKNNHVELANTLIDESVDSLNQFFPDRADLYVAEAMFAVGDFNNLRGNAIRAERYNSKGTEILDCLGLKQHFSLTMNTP